MKNNGNWIIPNGQYSQLKNLIKNLRLKETINSLCFCHHLTAVAKSGSRHTEIRRNKNTGSHLANTYFHNGHVMHRMFNVVGKLSKVIGLNSHVVFRIQFITYL